MKAVGGGGLIFRIEFGYQLHLTWGTLLGAVRDGDLMRMDFDIDSPMVSRARSQAGSAAVSARKSWRFFQAHGRVTGKPSLARFMLGGVAGPMAPRITGIEIWTRLQHGGAHYAYPILPGVCPPAGDAVSHG